MPFPKFPFTPQNCCTEPTIHRADFLLFEFPLQLQPQQLCVYTALISLRRERVAQLLISKLKGNLSSSQAPCVPLSLCRAHSIAFCTQKRTRTARKGWHVCASISEAMICKETLPHPHFTLQITKPSASTASDPAASSLAVIILLHNQQSSCLHDPSAQAFLLHHGEVLPLIQRCFLSLTHLYLLTSHKWRPQACVSPQLIQLTG